MTRVSTKAGRLLLLMRLRDDHVLDDRTLQEIGDVLGVDRSTVLRDLREVDEVEEAYRHLMATQPWVQREFSTTEFSTATGVDPEAVRAMIADGLIRAEKRDALWYIPRAELKRWVAFLRPTEVTDDRGN